MAKGTRWTDLAVERLKASASKRLELADALVPGLYLVVQPGGQKSWAVRGRLGGKPLKITLGRYARGTMGPDEARRRAGAVMDQLAHGQDPREARAAALAAEEQRRQETIGVVLEEFEKRHAGKLRSGAEMMRVLRRELGDVKWLGRSIHSIKRLDVLKVLDAAVDRGSPVQANRCLAHIRKLFNWAVERGVIAPTANPVAGLKPPTKEMSRDRALTNEELRTVWQAAGRLGYPFGPAVRLLIATAQRREEVGQLEWGEVDLKEAVWTMPASRNKGGRQHVVPLSQVAVDILTPLARAHKVIFTGGRPRRALQPGEAAPEPTGVSGWSMAKRIIDREAALLRAEARLGRKLRKGEQPEPIDALPAWVFHDLRRTAASGLVALGVRPDVVEAVLGHRHPSGSQLASVYQHHRYAPEMRDALDRWARHLSSLLDPSPSNVVHLQRA